MTDTTYDNFVTVGSIGPHSLYFVLQTQKKIRFCTAKYRKQPYGWLQSRTEQTYFQLQSKQDIATLQ
jgi:hypothetical protein